MRISPPIRSQSALLSRVASDARKLANASGMGENDRAQLRKLAIESEQLAKLAKLGRVVVK